MSTRHVTPPPARVDARTVVTLARYGACSLCRHGHQHRLIRRATLDRTDAHRAAASGRPRAADAAPAQRGGGRGWAHPRAPADARDRGPDQAHVAGTGAVRPAADRFGPAGGLAPRGGKPAPAPPPPAAPLPLQI